MLLLLPGAASGLEAGVLLGVSQQKSGHFGRAYDAGMAPAVALMVGGAPRNWLSLAGELRVSWYRDKEDFVGSIAELMRRLWMLPRRAGYVDWYPPEVLPLGGDKS
jgi:hypothetical protein